MKFKEFIAITTLRPSARLVRHVEYLRKNITINDETDRNSFTTIYNNFLETNQQLRLYTYIRAIVFFLLYVSVAAAFANNLLPAAGIILKPFIDLATFVGVTVLALILLFIQRIITAVYTELQVQHSHLIALAVKNNKDFEVHPKLKLGLYEAYE